MSSTSSPSACHAELMTSPRKGLVGAWGSMSNPLRDDDVVIPFTVSYQPIGHCPAAERWLDVPVQVHLPGCRQRQDGLVEGLVAGVQEGSPLPQLGDGNRRPLVGVGFQ